MIIVTPLLAITETQVEELNLKINIKAVRLCDRQTGTSMAPVHVASVKQTTGPNTAALQIKISIH